MKWTSTSLQLLAASLIILLAFPPLSVTHAHDEAVGFYYAYRHTQYLEAGRSYVIETTNLRKRDSLQYYNAETYVRLIDTRNERLIAQSKRYNGTARSYIEFTPTESKTYLILVSSTSSSRCGFGDLIIRDMISGFATRKDNIPFCGEHHNVRWYKGECFETRLSTGDPYLFLFHRSRAYRDDDSGPGRDARLCMEEDGSGDLLVSSYSLSTEGSGWIDLVEHSKLLYQWQLVGDRYGDRATYPFTYVYRKMIRLEAGISYIILTADLRKRDFFQSAPPDTILYVVDKDNEIILARSDDYAGGHGSLVIITPTETKDYIILVRSDGNTRGGFFDLYVNGTRIADDSPFGGLYLRSFVKSRDCIGTHFRVNGDPYMYYIAYDGPSGRIFMDDDSFYDRNPMICMHNTGIIANEGIVVIGSYSPYTEGSAEIYFDGSHH
jgi:hypothetical protein